MTEFSQNQDPFSRHQGAGFSGGEKQNAFNPNLYLNVYPPKGVREKKLKIRILPSGDINNLDPFMEIYAHNIEVEPSENFSNGKWKTLMCPKSLALLGGNNASPCPICEAHDKLLKESKAETDTLKAETIHTTAKGYYARLFYVIRCIDREHEDEGVKFWRFPSSAKNDGIFDKLKSIYQSVMDEVGVNIFDINNGYDINVTVSVDGNGKRAFMLTPVMNSSPLITNTDIANAWLYDNKTWVNAFPVKNYDYLNAVLVSKRKPLWDDSKKTFVPNLTKDEQNSVPQTNMVNENQPVQNNVQQNQNYYQQSNNMQDPPQNDNTYYENNTPF